MPTETTKPHFGSLASGSDVFVDGRTSAHAHLHGGRQKGLVADAGRRTVEGAYVTSLYGLEKSKGFVKNCKRFLRSYEVLWKILDIFGGSRRF